MRTPNAARDAVLERLKRYRDTPMSAESVESTDALTPSTTNEQTISGLISQFTQQLEAAHADVFVCDTEDWRAKLISLLEQENLKTIALNSENNIGAQLCEYLSATNKLTSNRKTDFKLIKFNHPIEAIKSELFNSAQVSVTGSLGGIASSGTIILESASDQPRTLSLVPPVHCVLVEAERITDTFQQAQFSDFWPEPLPTNLLLISGPSKTADIQQNLAYGAHGPKRLIVMII